MRPHFRCQINHSETLFKIKLYYLIFIPSTSVIDIHIFIQLKFITISKALCFTENLY